MKPTCNPIRNDNHTDRRNIECKNPHKHLSNTPGGVQVSASLKNFSYFYSPGGMFCVTHKATHATHKASLPKLYEARAACIYKPDGK
jgi:hypothetical protein